MKNYSLVPIMAHSKLFNLNKGKKKSFSDALNFDGKVKQT